MPMPIISFNKNTDPYGWLGNISAFPIQYNGKTWRTSEALFQALRFNDVQIQEEIRTQTSPIAAKMKAKKYKAQRVIQPQSIPDLDNMRLCLRLKFEQHSPIKVRLIRTEGNLLIEDVGKRNKPNDLFWGMKDTPNGWIGQNQLGLLLMELRDEYIRKLKASEN